MKKLLILLLSLITFNANALVVPTTTQTPMPVQRTYNNGYNQGKRDAYNNVARTVFIVGAVVIVGTIIYELGKESRWTTNENGITYRF